MAKAKCLCLKTQKRNEIKNQMTNALTNNGNGLAGITNNALIFLGNGCHGTGEVRLDGVCDVSRCAGKSCFHRNQNLKIMLCFGEGGR